MNFSNVSTIKAEVAALVELQQYQSAEGIISLLLCSKSQARSQRDEAELIGILGTLFYYLSLFDLQHIHPFIRSLAIR